MAGDPAYEYRRARSGVGKLFRKQGEPDPKRLYRVVVGPNGIHWSLQGQAGFSRWEDVPWVVQSITRRTVNGAYAGTDHHYALRLANGAVVRISGSEREGVQPKHSDGPAGSATLPITLAKLGSIIQTQITERQFPLVARAINAGQDVRFGPLTVSAAGIAQGEETVRWDEVEDVRVHQGVVTVKKAGKWFAWEKAKVGEIPNFFVFLEVVGRLRASTQGPAGPSR